MKVLGEGDARRNPTNGDEVLISVACWVTARGWLRGSLSGSHHARLTQPTRAFLECGQFGLDFRKCFVDRCGVSDSDVLLA